MKLAKADSSLRRRAAKCVDAQYALALFSCGIVRVEVDEAEIRSWIARASRRDLKHQIRRCEHQVDMIRAQLGATVPTKKFVRLLKEARKNNRRFTVHPKWHISRLLTNIGSLVSRWHEFPEHTLIRLPLSDDDPAGVLAVEWLEENGYNDMAMAWNKAIDSHKLALDEPEFYPTRTTGPRRRENLAFVRLSIQAALRFLESFLNGAAMNWYCLNEGKLDDSTSVLLLEWDEGNRRPKYLSLGKKVVKYSQLFAGSKQESIATSDPEIKYLVNTSIPVRNALTHPSARPKGARMIVDVSIHHSGHDIVVAGKTVDVCVSLAQRIGQLAYSSDSWLRWLRARGDNGLFEPVVANWPGTSVTKGDSSDVV